MSLSYTNKANKYEMYCYYVGKYFLNRANDITNRKTN